MSKIGRGSMLIRATFKISCSSVLKWRFSRFPMYRRLLASKYVLLTHASTSTFKHATIFAAFLFIYVSNLVASFSFTILQKNTLLQKNKKKTHIARIHVIARKHGLQKHKENSYYKKKRYCKKKVARSIY